MSVVPPGTATLLKTFSPGVRTQLVAGVVGEVNSVILSIFELTADFNSPNSSVVVRLSNVSTTADLR